MNATLTPVAAAAATSAISATVPATPAVELARNAYGEIITTSASKFLITEALALAEKAAAKKRLSKSFDSMAWERISSRKGSKMIGEAVHHDIYDVTADGKKALVCVREVEGTEYGIKTMSKEYFIVGRSGAHGVRVTPVNKSMAAKISKTCTEPGAAIKKLAAQIPVVAKAKKNAKPLVDRVLSFDEIVEMGVKVNVDVIVRDKDSFGEPREISFFKDGVELSSILGPFSSKQEKRAFSEFSKKFLSA